MGAVDLEAPPFASSIPTEPRLPSALADLAPRSNADLAIERYKLLQKILDEVCDLLNDTYRNLQRSLDLDVRAGLVMWQFLQSAFSL